MYVYAQIALVCRRKSVWTEERAEGRACGRKSVQTEEHADGRACGRRIRFTYLWIFYRVLFTFFYIKCSWQSYVSRITHGIVCRSQMCCSVHSTYRAGSAIEIIYTYMLTFDLFLMFFVVEVRSEERLSADSPLTYFLRAYSTLMLMADRYYRERLTTDRRGTWMLMNQ